MNGTDAILVQLGELSKRVDRLGQHQREDMSEVRDDIKEVSGAVAGLKVKAGVWGALAGMIPASIALVLIMVKLILDGK